MSLADWLLAHATTDAEEIATVELAFAEVARAEGLPVHPLPDSTGKRP